MESIGKGIAIAGIWFAVAYMVVHGQNVTANDGIIVPATIATLVIAIFF